MKLSELEPRWVGHSNSGVLLRMGITFLCPHCRSIRIGVMFRNPSVTGLNGEIVWPEQSKQWHHEGETFNDLTLTPSIDVSKYGHWHGTIVLGEIR
jgi:hypothetical protein